MGRLSRLLRPKSLAVFGGGWSESVIRQSKAMGFSGAIWPVHPTRTELAGLPCFPTVDELPAAPDASFIGVNRDATIEIVRSLARIGAGGAVCFASGFKEADDGADRQAALIEAAGEKMPILGPNCYGFINYLHGALLWPDQHGGRRVNKGVAIVMQSSNIAINVTMQQRGLPIAYLLTAGNQAQTGLSDLAAAALEDPAVTALGLHIEGFDDLARLEDVLWRAREKGIPVVVIKVGRSTAAKAITLSHTASLAGADDLATVFFERLGAARVASLDDFIETLKLLHVFGPLPKDTLGSMSCSGGEASLIADLVQDAGVNLPPLTRAETEKIAATLPSLVTISNPLDYHTFTWGDGESQRRTFGAMLSCGFGLTLLVLDFPRPDRCIDNGCEIALQAAIDAVCDTSGRLAVVASLPENMTEAIADRLLDAGIAPLMGLTTGITAAAKAAEIGRHHQGRPQARLNQARDAAGDDVVCLENDLVVLDEWASKQLLAKRGILVPKGCLVTSPEAAAKAAAKIGFPVVLKAVGAELAHKTELGAVVLNLKTAAAVQGASEKLLALKASFLVEEMVEGGLLELIIGVARDPQFGLYMSIGSGGVMVELLGDTKPILLPTSPEFLRETLLSLKLAPLLTGFRGRPVADIDAVVDVAMKVADFAIDAGAGLEELDINPLIVTASGAIAADALIRRREG